MSNQLVKKNPAEGYQNVFPKTFIDAIKDKESGVSLQEILQGFNMYFLSYNGSRALTRCKVPSVLRKEGLWITYVLYDHTVVTEWYNSDQIDDNSWSMDSNWRIASNNLVGDVSVSADGYWVINGIKTTSKAQGERGTTPLLRIYDNKLQVSYTDGKTYNYIDDNPVFTQYRTYNNKIQVSRDLGKTWEDASEELAYKFKVEENKLKMSKDLGHSWETISDYIAAQFRWVQEGTSNNIGKIQISRDEGKTWSNLTNSFSNNLHISRYIGANETLPTTDIAEGTIYMKGPYYDENDTNNDYPIYRMWVYAWKGNTLAWQDNGEFTSISAGVVQWRGTSTTEVMSQDAVTRELAELESAARCVNPKESNNVDLYIADEIGNSIAEFEAGHVRTQKFNSETDGQISVLNKQDGDVEIADENGYVILELKDGEVRTKNFDTKKTPEIAYDIVDDLDIADENGNILLRIKDGHLQTQRFDSSAQENNTLKGKKFSIIGDSISTYSGYVETTDGDGYRAFGSYHQGNANMPSVNDTWWMKFAKQTGMELLKNCSWSGSLVCGNSSSTTTASAGCSTKRVNDLARDGVTPDIVLIYMGINDMAYNKEVGTWNGSKTIPQDSTSINIFSDAYVLMVDKVMRTYPKAQVCCFTLLESLQFGNNSKFPTINNSKVALKAYNDVIKEVASSLGCNLIDLHACGINTHNLDDYTIDRLHPTYKGTTLMANKVSQEIISKVQL